MRLLKRLPAGDGFELTSFSDDLAPPYAILSHTWTDGQEVTYNELLAGTGADKPGYAKIRFCGERATADSLEYFWVDTCCIDKSTNNELNTAINSMFRWYQGAAKCYVYLTDVPVPEEVTNPEAFPISWQQAFQRSRWFTRGWTLQELLAPASVEFFSQDGKRLGSRISLEQEIHSVTGIPVEALRGHRLTEFSVDKRMSWAAKRTTTLKEDKVYCLLGIFGVFLPLLYGEGEEYATQRLKEEIQKRQQGRENVDVQDLSVSLSLPFPRNELFVGRESQLQAIEQTLLSPNTHRRMTIYGLGGCGKSALALEFAYCALAGHARRLVFWVPAMSRESFELAYREIGICLRIPGISDDNADCKRLVKERLSLGNLGNWLMIVDNADDSKVLLEVDKNNPKSARLIDSIPHSNEGAILFTTRSRKAATDLTQSNVLELNDMGKAEARQLLVQRTTRQALLNDEAAVEMLLEKLTGLPLAIVQAAAFINQNNTLVSEYVSLLQHAGTKAELFSEHFEDPSRYRDMDSTVAKTWHISFEQIRRQDPLAAEYLSFIACIDRIGIPQSLLLPGGSSVQQTKALGTLTGYAFITERQQTVPGSNKERLFDMHRLVHMALIGWLEGRGERANWAGTAAARAEELVPYGEHEGKEVWSAYLPHAMYVAGLVDIVDGATISSLLGRIGWCQESLGQYAPAEASCRKALSLRKEVLGPEHPATLASMNNLAEVLGRQGKYEEAKAINQQTLVQTEKLLGPKHPKTLISINNLALLLRKQGKYEEAEALYQETLAQREKVLGPEHPSTLTSMSNLATVLYSQGKYKEAETIYQQTLAQLETVLGFEHSLTLTSMSNLALALTRQGKYKEAETINRQTLAQSEKVLGPEHPDTLTSVYNLAFLLTVQHRFDESLLLYQRASTGYNTILGKDHPTTVECHQNYADMCALQAQHQLACSSSTLERDAGTSTRKR
ncbi:kinesin light chain 1 [Dothidotthia symphoricarpi CBS 119687]|uniref:Kinesin light chain 1 n=1 Tax=Dothidotthia symphoricarpi CBS 119687 TaxID=1392245 RepID=A0A6A6AAS7_9PLEO|nr:kinesin light chain 1 [Dothidotthia symphoricarpi CBS 119687]KAF2128313.1 kinesin light chain 1 [Dothidotthia symphoricarpi CBS 119687]